jgi:hypothetical protein
VIRNNGGWNNWSMEIINFFNCQDHFEARQKEQEFFVSLNATLNSIEPIPKPINVVVQKNKEKQTFHCEKCDKVYSSRVGLWKHKKICDNTQIDNDVTGLNVIIKLIKQNDDFKKLLIEQCKTLTEQNKILIEQNKIIIELSKNKG